jgi:penicillin V acylase-like amidase (Ntn superfamily)
VSDHDAKRYYFDSSVKPAVFWIDIDRVDLKPRASPNTIDVIRSGVLSGEISAKLKAAEPFKWLK